MSEDPRSNVIAFPRERAEKANLVTLNRTSITSTKMFKNNDLGEECHRPNIPFPITVTVTVTEKEKSGKRGTVSPYEASVTDEQWRNDIATMTKGQLQAAYPGTFISFKDMKYVRSKPIEKGGEGAFIGATVEAFADFMKAIGPRRHADMTVDRLDTNDPTYAFGKIAWRDKRQQANNRSSNSHVRNPRANEWGTVAEVAEQVGLKPNTITVALKRAIEKNPADELNIRAYIVGDLLLRNGLDNGHAAGDPGTTGEILDMPGYDMADDPVMRWPWPLNKGQRQWFEEAYQREKTMEQVPRRVQTAYGSHIGNPWRPISRYDFGMRMCERKRLRALDTIAEIEHHAREYILSPEDEADLVEAKATVARMEDHLAAARRDRPAFLEELAEHQAINGRTLAPWEVIERAHAAKVRAEMEREARRDSSYVDEEDAEMKRAERGE